jgi:hypothetical protein
MEPEGSSPCSQEPSTGPYPKPDRSSPYKLRFQKVLIRRPSNVNYGYVQDPDELQESVVGGSEMSFMNSFYN